MLTGQTADSQSHRGRIVVLVDNNVNGDSRVQKTAQSAAEAGWEVVLLGRSPDDESHTWQLGGATVRLIELPFSLSTRRHEFRRAWLRRPLAYPPNGIAEYRTQWVKGLKADLRIRRALLVQSGKTGNRQLRSRLKWLALRGQSAAAGALERWVRFRTDQLRAARRSRRKLDRPRDVLYTRFWQAVKGDRCWRRLDPQLWDYELAFGKVIDRLAPDLIHANDFRMLGVGARAAIRARARGRPVKLVWDAHEFLPGIKPWHDNARWLPANCAHEREYAPYADAVITVSDRLAELLQERHGLPERPTVVLNAPGAGDALRTDDSEPPDIRELCGIGPEVPLLVYSGAPAKQRGLDIMVEALPQLPKVHVAFVVNKDNRYVRSLLARSRELEVDDRLHVLPYVPHWHVVRFLSGADAGVIPIHHWPNHELALITKFFEYSHARLPMLVSDVRTMAETVRSTGQGEVFRAEDLADYVRAVQAVLADPRRYQEAYERLGLLENWTWQRQAEILDDVYTRLVPSPGHPAELDGKNPGLIRQRQPTLTRVTT